MTDQSLIDYKHAKFSRLHKKVLFGGAFGQFSEGYILGTIGIALTLATHDLGLTPMTLGILGAASLIGLMFGSLSAGAIADRIGRKPIYLSTMVVFAVASVLQFFVSTSTELLILRLILGLAIGADYAAGVTLVAEWTPVEKSAQALSFMQAVWVVGYVLAYVAGCFFRLAGPGAWRWILLSGVLPSLFALWVRAGTPESPLWLMTKDRAEEAKGLVQKFLGTQYTVIQGEKVKALGWGALFSPGQRTRSLVSGGFYAFQVIPYFALSIFLPLIFEAFHLKDPYMMGIVFNIVLLIGVIFGILIVDKVSRRSFLISSFYICAVALLVMAVVPNAGRYTVLICTCIFGFTVSAGSVLQYAYPPELFPNELRGSGIGFTIACSRVGAASGTFLLPIILHDLGIVAAVLCCVASLLAGGLMCQFFAPETSVRFKK